ncbi:MHS family MFS transporter, partial [Salmonella enterica subsp. enterica serovar Typhimurium]|nr:MHS family MFS transporter [Salmonella enterica subsp. enterica serovar Typhimurium]
VSAVIAGGIAPLVGSAIISWVIHTNDPSGIAAWMPIAIYLSLLTVGTIIATFFAPETRDRDLDDLADAETISVSQHNQTTGTYHDA